MIVLASGSIVRRRLLTQVGITFTVVPADVDESILLGEDAVAFCQRMAHDKAAAVDGDVVIGADQVGVHQDGSILRKCQTAKKAAAQLRSMAGGVHRFISCAAIRMGTDVTLVQSEAKVHMHALDDDEIDAYISLGEWRGSAGSFQLENRGAALFSSVDGNESAVLGFPIYKVLSELRRLGAG